jgi:hypothetical protein
MPGQNSRMPKAESRALYCCHAQATALQDKKG